MLELIIKRYGALLYECEFGELIRERELIFDFWIQIKLRSSTAPTESHYMFCKIISLPIIY
jgi:hypothetical protein